MENFDVEKLERKLPSTLPEDFFAEMQANVLAKTVYASPQIGIKDSAPAKKHGWMYAAAASVAAIFGAGYFMNNSSENSQEVARVEPAVQQPAVSAPVIKTENAVPVPPEAAQSIATVAEYKAVKEDLTSAKISHPKNKSVIAAVQNTPKAANNSVTISQATPDMETVLDQMPETAINEMALNTEQDVYLDLYN